HGLPRAAPGGARPVRGGGGGGWGGGVVGGGGGGPRREVARHLVDSGRVGGGELEICHLGAVFDAAFFALAPGSGPTRFRYGVAHWFGTVRPVSAAAVARETLRRRELLDSVWPYGSVDSAPVVVREPAPGQSVPRRQRDVLALADGTRTAAAIARALGRPAFHVLLDIRRLAAAGLVDIPQEPLGPVESTPEPLAPEQSTPEPLGPAESTGALPARVARLSDDPDIALLRRLRDALEATL
ncbi:transcriptional regulator, partial [Streptomyces sp. 8L]|uniref:transcriptional regulator n=1 Tax=Streptomyces sp. 8L TaxID=2877242 RepID=UPI001CD19D67